MLLFSLGFQVLSQMKMAIDLLNPTESSSLTSSVYCLMHTSRHRHVTQCVPVPNNCGRISLPDRIQTDHPSSCKSGVQVIQKEKEELACLTCWPSWSGVKRSQLKKDFFVEDQAYENYTRLFRGFYRSYDLCKQAANRSRASSDSSYVKNWNKMVTK